MQANGNKELVLIQYYWRTICSNYSNKIKIEEKTSEIRYFYGSLYCSGFLVWFKTCERK